MQVMADFPESELKAVDAILFLFSQKRNHGALLSQLKARRTEILKAEILHGGEMAIHTEGRSDGVVWWQASCAPSVWCPPEASGCAPTLPGEVWTREGKS